LWKLPITAADRIAILLNEMKAAVFKRSNNDIVFFVDDTINSFGSAAAPNARKKPIIKHATRICRSCADLKPIYRLQRVR
jgi:hypothetical protein